MRLDLDRLHVFREAARAGSYTRAAARLHVTQSAVSHAIRKLEQSIDRPLVEWRARRLHLTWEGELLLDACERVFGDLEEVEERLLGGTSGPRLTVRLGATVEFGTTVLIRKMRPLLQAHPTLHVDYLFAHDLATPLLRDDIDLALDCQPHVHPAVVSLALFREAYAAVASDEFLARYPVGTPRDLADAVVLSMDEAGDWWANLLRALPPPERPTFRKVVQISHVRGIVNAALDGQGVGFVPRYAVLQELADGRLRRLFPDLHLLEDRFSIVQKRARAGRLKNRIVTDFLLGLDVSEFGDAISTVSA